jgi:hypothetical protein
MKTVILAVALAAAAGLAFADDPEAMTCADFVTLPSDRQVAALSTIEPLGDDIDAADATEAVGWAADVSDACGGHPERLLTDAARDALAE